VAHKTQPDNTRTLCVIDMQNYFAETADKRLPQVLKEINLAKRRHAGIIILEYNECGRSHPTILEILKGYDRVRYVRKCDNDGSSEFIQTALKRGFNLGKVRFCGVNRSFCVQETVKGFLGEIEDSDVEIAIDATWCYYPRSGRAVLRKYGRFVKTRL